MATMSPSGMEAGATPPTPSTEQGRGGGNAGSAAAKDEESKLYEFKEQLLLLSTLVATVTYVAGLNLPGGYWEQGNPGGHVPGDPILPDTHYRRYLAFYYCNATALAASLVVSLILIALPNKRKYWTVALRSVMMLDLLGLMGAYGAGSCRDAFTTIYAVVIFSSLVVVIIFVFFYVCHMAKDSPSTQPPTGGSLTSTSPPVGIVGSTLIPTSPGGVLDKNHSTTNEAGGAPDSNLATIIVHENEVQSNSSSKANKMKRGSMFKHATTKIRALIKFKKPDKKRAEKEQIDVLMLLATFVVTITYVAGLSPPGGFWSSTQDGHHLSDPVLQARGRYRGFFICNTTSFAVSLLIIVLLLERKLLKAKLMSTGFTVRFTVPYLLVAVTLLGLMGAYAAGGCREADNTALVLAVPACVSLLLGIVTYIIGWKELTHIREYVIIFLKKLVGIPSGTCPGTDIELHHQNTRDLVMLLATLVVTITYQAGLEPPGGLWLDDRDGHKMSHPVLEVTHPTRYKVFFYSNSAAFITSLVVIMMLQSKFLLTRHTLEATLVLDLFGLVTAYGAGSTRDVNTSIYIVALAGLVLVYVIVHITIRDHTPEPADDHAVKHLDDKRKVLLLVAILAATLTYQAGLTPPGGFWLEDDQGLGRRAGFPVLLDNYPRRYNSFFYCNAASFMASITLILLLVNPKLYRPGIRCYALYVCMLVGMFGLMGAYAAGSARQLKTSIYVLTLVGMVLAFIVWLAAISWLIIRSRANKKENNNSNNNRSTAISITTAISSSTSTTSGESSSSNSGGGSTTSSNHNSGGGSSSSNNSCSTTTSNKNNSNNDGDNNPEKDTLEYLMLLGILVASMTYQTGLKPPGGLWQDNNSEHSAGNPVLHDINKHRYNIFFYSNTTSFMASIIVIVLLLPWTTFHEPKPPLWPMHMTILLDMVGLLVAYAAGSTRDWEASRNIMFLIIPVLFYIALYATASVLFRKEGRSCKTWLASWWPAQQAEPGSGEQQKTSHSWSSLCLHTQPSSTGKTEVALAV